MCVNETSVVVHIYRRSIERQRVVNHERIGRKEDSGSCPQKRWRHPSARPSTQGSAPRLSLATPAKGETRKGRTRNVCHSRCLSQRTSNNCPSSATSASWHRLSAFCSTIS